MPEPRLVPNDCVLLPISGGALLVSPSEARFCRIDEQELALIRRVIGGETASLLPPALIQSLHQHGFGSPASTPLPASPSVQIQLTNACNLACIYCCTNSASARAEELSFETASSIVDDTVAILGHRTRLGLLGGEPLLVPWAVDLAEYVVDRGLSLCLFTNGMLLNERDTARRLGVLCQRGAEVRVSLAGATSSFCDPMSGGPRFHSALSGIQTLASYGPAPSIDLMLFPAHIDHIAEHLSELRAQLPSTAPLAFGLAYLSGRETGAHTFPSPKQLELALDQIAFRAGECIPAVRTETIARRRDGCSCALGHHLHVRSDGALFTCFKMEEQIGHLKTMTFGQALQSLPAMKRPAFELAYCRECPLRTLCGAGCRSENLLHTGDGDVPICGPWRVRVLSELLGEGQVDALEWPATHLLAEALERGIDAPPFLPPIRLSRHLIDVT